MIAKITNKRTWAILGLAAIAGLAFALFGGVAPGASNGDAVDAAVPGGFKVEVVHCQTPCTWGGSTLTELCFPEDAMEVAALIQEHLDHPDPGHIVKVGPLPRSNCR